MSKGQSSRISVWSLQHKIQIVSHISEIRSFPDGSCNLLRTDSIINCVSYKGAFNLYKWLVEDGNHVCCVWESELLCCLTTIRFKSRLSLLVRVNVGLLLLTVTDVSTTCAVLIFRVKVSCITSVDGIINFFGYHQHFEVLPFNHVLPVKQRQNNKIE